MDGEGNQEMDPVKRTKNLASSPTLSASNEVSVPRRAHLNCHKRPPLSQRKNKSEKLIREDPMEHDILPQTVYCSSTDVSRGVTPIILSQADDRRK